MTSFFRVYQKSYYMYLIVQSLLSEYCANPIYNYDRMNICLLKLLVPFSLIKYLIKAHPIIPVTRLLLGIQ